MKQRGTNNKLTNKKRNKKHKDQKVKRAKSSISSSLFPTTNDVSTSLVSSIFGDDTPSSTNKSVATTATTTNTSTFDLFSTQKANQLSKVIQERMKTNQNQLSTSTIITKKEVTKVLINEKCTTANHKTNNQNKKDDSKKKNERESSTDDETILEYRRKRILNQEHRNIIDSISVALPDFIDNNNNEDDYDDYDDNNKEKCINGIQRLFTNQADAIMRENGVLIVKSNDDNIDTPSSLKTTISTTKRIFDPKLLQTMSLKAKEIEKKICTKLQQKGHIWEQSSSTTSSSIQQSNNEQKHAFQYHEVASRCFGRLDIRYQMNQTPFTKPNIITNTLIHPIIQSLLGSNATLVYVGLIVSFPNSVDQPWHQDGTLLFENNENEDFLFRNEDVHLPPYALNVFIPLEDVTEEVGPTEFYVGSHYTVKAKKIMESHHATTTNSGGEENDDDDEVEEPIGPLLKSGDVLIYDYRVCHRGTKNLSIDKTRPMLYLMYARPWFQEHLNFGKERLFDDDD